VSVETLLDRFASVSFVAVLPPDERAALLGEVRAAAAGCEEPIRIPYVTRVFVVDRLTPAAAS
jgi:hypothetical protein